MVKPIFKESALTILVTGAAGYIGSHTCLELLNNGFGVVAYDNLSNSSAESLRRVEQLAGRAVTLVYGDVLDETRIKATIEQHRCSAVIHFAGLKAVGESVSQPLRYYENNVAGTLSLLRAMTAVGLKRLVFSSSATVYGCPERLPLDEGHPLCAANPYGQTKLLVERMLFDLHHSDPSWAITILRYFNPVGAHPSGAIGEDPRGPPNNLMPFIAQVAVGRRPTLSIWGKNYQTHDGTGVRDYIHVVDLARGHVRALEKLPQPGCVPINLGTGRGYSVLDVIKTFEEVSGKSVNYRFAEPRPGDVAACYANASTAEQLLGWRAEKTLAEMCSDHWRWQSRNPEGYTSAHSKTRLALATS
jgi:UDP-glucose 4-epimerase